MSLFDQLGAASGMLGGGQNPAGSPGRQGGQGAVIGAILGMLQNQQGGLGGVISGFERSGLGGMAQSWLQNGANQPVSPGQVQQALGPGAVNDVAQRLGVGHEEAAGHLSQYLPQIMEHLSPGGQLPQDGGASGLGGLMSKLGLG